MTSSEPVVAVAAFEPIAFVVSVGLTELESVASSCDQIVAWPKTERLDWCRIASCLLNRMGKPNPFRLHRSSRLRIHNHRKLRRSRNQHCSSRRIGVRRSCRAGHLVANRTERTSSRRRQTRNRNMGQHSLAECSSIRRNRPRCNHRRRPAIDVRFARRRSDPSPYGAVQIHLRSHNSCPQRSRNQDPSSVHNIRALVNKLLKRVASRSAFA